DRLVGYAQHAGRRGGDRQVLALNQSRKRRPEDDRPSGRRVCGEIQLDLDPGLPTNGAPPITPSLEDAQPGAHRASPLGDHRTCRLRGGGDGPVAGLDDPRLLGGDRLHVVAQPFAVVKGDVGDDAPPEVGDVGAVQPPPHPDLADQGLRPVTGGRQESHRGEHLELGGMLPWRSVAGGAEHLLGEGTKAALGERLSVQDDPLPPAHQMRLGEKRRSASRRACHRFDQGGDRALPISAGDEHPGEPELRVAQPIEEPPRPLQAGHDPEPAGQLQTSHGVEVSGSEGCCVVGALPSGERRAALSRGHGAVRGLHGQAPDIASSSPGRSNELPRIFIHTRWRSLASAMLSIARLRYRQPVWWARIACSSWYWKTVGASRRAGSGDPGTRASMWKSRPRSWSKLETGCSSRLSTAGRSSDSRSSQAACGSACESTPASANSSPARARTAIWNWW